MKKLYKIIALPLMIIFIASGCSSLKKPDVPVQGEIESVEKLRNKDRTPGSGTKTGMSIGSGFGGFIGAVGGATVGVGASIVTFGAASPAMPGFVVAGALIGAGTGAVIGGTTGYIYDYTAAGSGLYEYKVITQDEGVLTVRQISGEPFEVSEAVTVIWKENQRVITSLDLN